MLDSAQDHICFRLLVLMRAIPTLFFQLDQLDRLSNGGIHRLLSISRPSKLAELGGADAFVAPLL